MLREHLLVAVAAGLLLTLPACTTFFDTGTPVRYGSSSGDSDAADTGDQLGTDEDPSTDIGGSLDASARSDSGTPNDAATSGDTSRPFDTAASDTWTDTGAPIDTGTTDTRADTGAPADTGTTDARADTPDPDVSTGTEQCTNGTDDDGDGLVDCDDDDCRFAAECLYEECETRVDCDKRDCWFTGVCSGCPDIDIGSRMGSAVATGTTTGAGDEASPMCISSDGEDITIAWTAPEDGVYTFTTAGSDFDTVLGLHADSCFGYPLGCNVDDSSLGNGWSSIRTYLDRGDTVVVIIDGWMAETGDYVLNIFSS